MKGRILKLAVLLVSMALFTPIVPNLMQSFMVQPWQPFSDAMIPSSGHARTSALSQTASHYLSAGTLEHAASSIIDPRGDATPSYKDVIFAEVFQVASGLQFNMTLASKVPKRIKPGQILQYFWLLDTDQNPATGDKRNYVGCDYEVCLMKGIDEGPWSGFVYVYKKGEFRDVGQIFVYGNTISMRIGKVQIGSPHAFNWEIYAISESGEDDYADGYATTKLSEKPRPHNGISKVLVYPPHLTLRDGKTTEKVKVLALDVDDNSLPLKGRQIQFISSQPFVAKVNKAGRVKGIGYGGTQICARVDGVISSNAAQIAAGRFSLTPAILHLSLIDQPTGKLTVRLEKPNGTSVSLAGKKVEFSSDNEAIATVSKNGMVTAHNYSKPTTISVLVDGRNPDNWSYIRVSNSSLGLKMLTLPGENIVFEIAKKVRGFNYEKIFKNFEGVRVTDIAYQLEKEATSIEPNNGGIQYMVNEVGYDSESLVACGINGNPCILGSNLDYAGNCLINEYDPPYPCWFVIFHELGHNFTFASQRFCDFINSDSDGDYSEGLATLAGFYAIQKLLTKASTYSLSDKIVTSLGGFFGAYLHDLDVYVAAGADYKTLDANILDGIMVRLEEDYGLSFWYRFFSVFLPTRDSLEVDLTTDAEVATYFVAACSAAARTDLRSRFRNEWGFPIINNFYNRIYPDVQKAVAQRDPRARIRAERKVKVGDVVRLDGKSSWDLQGLPLTYTWTIAKKPAGSIATLSGASRVSPTFIPDKQGKYTVELTVDNGLVVSLIQKKVISAKF